MSDTLVELSRWQFALTAMFHFIFVPLTLGLSFLLAIMESVYVMTGKEIYKQMTQFWGKLFGINFAIGVATGLTMEFHKILVDTLKCIGFIVCWGSLC